MRKTHILLTTLAVGMSAPAFAALPQLGKAPLDSVIAAMTIEEKAGLLVGTGMMGTVSVNAPVVGNSAERVPGAAGATNAVPRLGIPSVVVADGPAGLRIDPTREGTDSTFYCTHFPIGTLLASTWNVPLVSEVGAAMGNEVLEYGCDVLLAPGMNIHRNPLCGRNFEYYSEDPVVAGDIAAAYVNGVQSQGVGTSPKHFAANSQETNRGDNISRISQRALRELYLRNFERMVKQSKPWTIMSSYNRLNGPFTAENEELLTEVLRDQWGYDGIVMSDWGGGRDASAAMFAGNDLLEPGDYDRYEQIVADTYSGKLPIHVLDTNVKRMLEFIMLTPSFRGYKYSNAPDLKAHAATTRQSATEGMVLLKNDNDILPLKANGSNVAVLGCTSYDFIAGGTGSGNVNRAYTISLLDGLKNAGFNVDESMREQYEKHIAEERVRHTNPDAWRNQFFPPIRPVEIVPTQQQLASLAANNDAALITLGRISGEFFDRTPSDFNLKPEERQLLQTVSEAFHAAGKPVIVVLNVGGAIETASWREMVDGILLAWQAGQEGGNSVADILSGAVNPSGKLTMTWPMAFDDHASSANFPTEGREPSFLRNDNDDQSKEPENLWDYTDYEEDIYVGYRYFDSFDKPVAYPFGFGKSYTQFEYSNPEVSERDSIYTVTVDVKNVGKMAGKEVVELYAAAPNAKASNKPEHELRAFAKTQLLAPGQTQKVSMTFPAADLASFDDAISAWVVTPGEYQFQLGSSSRDIRASVPVQVAPKTKYVKQLLATDKPIKRLKH